MNKIEKQALKIIKEKARELKIQKQEIYKTLLLNETYKNLHNEEVILKIELAKLQFENKDFNKEKSVLDAIILKKKLIEKNYSTLLEKEYNCSLCCDEGYLEQNPCLCLKKEISKTLLCESGINMDLPSFAGSDFSIFENKEEIRKLYKTLEKWQAKFKISLVLNWGLFGNTGTGKTHLMLCVANALIEKGHYIYFTTAFKMSKELLSQHTDFEDTTRDYISKYIDCEVLFVDDLGTEPLYNNVSENYMYLILNQRMLDNKPVIFSTNLDMEGLRERYGERIFSRLVNKNKTKSLWLSGKDLRITKK